MGKIRDLVIAAPVLCEAENAGRWQLLNQLGFDYEVKRGGVLGRSEDDIKTPGNRISMVFGFTSGKHNKKKAAYLKGLFTLAELTHYKGAHGERDWDGWIEGLKKELGPLEAENPEVAALLTVEEASDVRLMSNWI